MNCIKKMIPFMLFLCSMTMLHAQQAPFGVKGTVVDLESFQPLAGATISIANSKLATTTNEKGEFFLSLPNDKSLEYLVRATLLGYDAQELEFSLSKNDVEFISFALKGSNAVIEEVVVTRRRERASELAILEERKKSNLMLETIGAQELSRKGVSDAQAALTKMAGVSRQEGVRNVLVRGLGDRFNSTSLNGLPLPSEDPLYKNISLHFFSSDVIQSINANKTFNPLIGGDVAGANIDIYTKEATGNDFQIGVSGGVNSQTVGKDNFRRIDGTNFFGTLKNGSKYPITDLGVYNFKNSFTPNPVNSLFNSGLKLAINRRYDVKNNPLSVFFSAGMDSKYRFMHGVNQGATTDGSLFKNVDYTSNEYHVSQDAMLNVRYAWKNNFFAFNSLYIHDQIQALTDMHGMDSPEQNGDKDVVRRQQVNDNHLLVNQLLSKLELTEKWTADLGLGFNYTIGNEPDRRNVRLLERNDNISFQTGSANNVERFYSRMNEKGLTARAIFSYNLNEGGEFERKIDFGYNGNILKRDFTATIYSFPLIPPYKTSVDINTLDDFFNNDQIGKTFTIVSGNGRTSIEPFYYTGNKSVHSALASLTYQVDERFTALIGARFDKVHQKVIYNTNLGNSVNDGPSLIDKNYFLPSVNLKYSLNDKMFLRAAGSMSYIMPQFIEVAPMLYNGQNINTQGNFQLKPSDVINADLKWELYPNASELVSVGVFYKNIKNPIARTQLFGSGSNSFSFANTGSKATVLGAEIEVKKDLIRHNNAYGENVLSAGLNASYLFSEQRLEDSFSRFTKSKDKLEGAAPWLVNADVSYKANFNNFTLQPTLQANYFADRIYALGVNDYYNVMEKGYTTLDFILNSTIKQKWGLNLKAENILNPARQYSRTFSNNAPKLLIDSYKRGMDFSLGLSYKF